MDDCFCDYDYTVHCFFVHLSIHCIIETVICCHAQRCV